MTTAITLNTPGTDELGEIAGALAAWPRDGAPVQLHVGDLGWFWRFGAEATATALRIWRRDRELVAVGLLDGHELLRLAVAPSRQDDTELARHLVDDLSTPERGVLTEPTVYVEARSGAVLDDRFSAEGWGRGEAWTPLSRDLTEPVESPGVAIEVIGPEQAHVRADVQRAAFDGSTFTDERWHIMAAGLPYAGACCLVAYDEAGTPVAAVTVWPAGPGRPGLLEPMGAHRDHRGRGFGRAITVAAAAALRHLGASSAIVCTPSANSAAVATYMSAGFVRHPDVRDRVHSA